MSDKRTKVLIKLVCVLIIGTIVFTSILTWNLIRQYSEHIEKQCSQEKK